DTSTAALLAPNSRAKASTASAISRSRAWSYSNIGGRLDRECIGGAMRPGIIAATFQPPRNAFQSTTLPFRRPRPATRGRAFGARRRPEQVAAKARHARPAGDRREPAAAGRRPPAAAADQPRTHRRGARGARNPRARGAPQAAAVHRAPDARDRRRRAARGTGRRDARAPRRHRGDARRRTLARAHPRRRPGAAQLARPVPRHPTRRRASVTARTPRSHGMRPWTLLPRTV